MLAITIKIYGKVQGVSFRYHMKEQAYSFGINGWVRNRIDGSVEAFLQGEPSAVHELIDWCRKGPSEAVVDTLDLYNTNIDQGLSNFIIRSTC